MKTLKELGISPAPWNIRDCIDEDGNICGKWLVDGNGNDLITELDSDSVEGITANARLIAAAPELYEALQFVNERISFSAVGGGADVVAEARRKMTAALAAASCESEVAR